MKLPSVRFEKNSILKFRALTLKAHVRACIYANRRWFTMNSNAPYGEPLLSARSRQAHLELQSQITTLKFSKFKKGRC